MSTAIFTDQVGSWASFAIPMDIAMEVVEQLKDKGTVSRGWLGVQIQRVDRDLAEFSDWIVLQAPWSQGFCESPAERPTSGGRYHTEFGGRAVI